MFHLLDSIYLRQRKVEIEKAKRRLKKISIDNILQCIEKGCWKYNIQFDIVLKDHDMLLLKLMSCKQTVLLKYHRTDMVFSADFERFLNLLKNNNLKRGIYITTGVFEGKIAKDCSHLLFNYKVRLEDNFHFIKRQLGYSGKTEDIIKNNKLKFYYYLP